MNTIKQSKQEFTSADTSINSAKVPAIFKHIDFKPNTFNLDYGGGRFDTASEYLRTLGVHNYIYDPYNRSFEHNDRVLKTMEFICGANTVTCSNVLNVIKEKNIRLEVVENMLALTAKGGSIYIKVYEGNRSGINKETTKGFQMNCTTSFYLNEIKESFPEIKVSTIPGGIIRINK